MKSRIPRIRVENAPVVRVNAMWATAGVMTAVAFVLWAVAIHLGRADRKSQRLATIGAISATLGAIAWVRAALSTIPTRISLRPGRHPAAIRHRGHSRDRQQTHRAMIFPVSTARLLRPRSVPGEPPGRPERMG